MVHLCSDNKGMREAHQPQARNWPARQGSSRHFPVRHDPTFSADINSPGDLPSPPGRLRRWSLAFALVTLGSLIANLSSASAATPEPRPWVDLDAGTLGSYAWSVKAKRPSGHSGDGRQGAQRPCIVVGTILPVSRYSFTRSRYRRCTESSSRLTASEPLVIASGARPGLAGPAKFTAVGMVFAPAARFVRATFVDGSSETIALRSLSPTQSHSSRLMRFRFAAFAVTGTWCAERLVSLSASGRTLWDTGTDEYPCPLGSAPRLIP